MDTESIAFAKANKKLKRLRAIIAHDGREQRHINAMHRFWHESPLANTLNISLFCNLPLIDETMVGSPGSP